MRVPLLDVPAQNLPLEAEMQAAFLRVFRSGRFILGEEVEMLENQLAGFLGVKHAIGCSSGTDALLVALMAAGIQPSDEVLCPAFTFFATAGCVRRLGAVPVFVDVCARCFNIEPSDAEKKITAKTRAMIPVHLFGQSAAMPELLAIAERHNLVLIEDAAQAFGATSPAGSCGALGLAGITSFFPSKNLGGCGDGGMLFSNDDYFAAKVRMLRNHGAEPKYYHALVGGNFRLDALQAALLAVKVPHYESYTAQRQANAAFYTQELLQHPDFALEQAPCQAESCACSQGGQRQSDPKIILPQTLPDHFHIWNQYTLRVPNGQRDALRQHLAAEGVGHEIYYPLSLDEQTCFSDLPSHCLGPCKTSRRLASEVLSVPIYPELSRDQLSIVAKALIDFCEKN
ncbi:MAG: DegT/DnrJ/EryC1/StrS family aminotransferase [Verrucomicrobiales bacterium]